MDRATRQRLKKQAIEQKAKEPVKEPEPEPKRFLKDRLPDGAHFSVTYRAHEEKWYGSLAIDGKSFTGDCVGVFGLLRKLDKQYRKTMKPQVDLSQDGSLELEKPPDSS